jgi:uncharacterized membrane protein YtjA (UPF0391 family)
MLRLAILFFVIALIAALFGFNVIEGYSFLAAKIAFIAFLVLAIVAAASGALRGRAPV